MHHVILGAGPAGVIAAEMLRKYDADSAITLIGGENEPPYSRMAIPYFLSGQINAKGTHLRHGKDHYKALDIKYRKDRAEKLNTRKKRLMLESGKEIEYDRLLIATGASPIKPKIDGLKLKGVHNCWTLDDAREIARLAKKGQPVVLVGAGFIGSIILEALAAKGVKLTVVEMGDRMVPRMMDETAGNMLKRWCEEKGIRVLTRARIKKITRGKHGLNATLSSGEKLPARLIVIATGVAPNTSFLKGSGIKTGSGITVDNRLRTSAPDVFAAGDVAEGRDMSTGQFSVLAIQPTAVEHGRIAALNMTGLDTPHEGSLNMNVLDTLGLVSSSFGAWDGVKGGSTARTGDPSGYRYLRLEFGGDRLVGAQAVGMTDNIGMLRGLIQTGLRLGDWKNRLIKAPERLAEAYVATAQGIPPV
ncbi:MAG: FAD-dependent oxidoreductase [Pseudomonadota bacterium]|nr:FAD-dependent oxidoreductase [Pseudomonadota bacterium]